MTIPTPRPITVFGNAMTAALWVAVCAMTPEFIWRGARVVAHHFSWGDAVSALLIGLILTFCIEPAMERARHALFGHKHGGPEAYSPLFAAAAGVAFALASVCLHDAMTAFLATHAEQHDLRKAGLALGLQIALSWAIVPFCTTLAWLAAAKDRAAWPAGVVALLMPFGAAWIFGWSLADTMTTALPCTAFLLLGYRLLRDTPAERVFPRAARGILWVGLAWLLLAHLVDMLLAASHLTAFRLYTWQELWIDLRFYLGWCMGLLLAPFPFRLGHGTAKPLHSH